MKALIQRVTTAKVTGNVICAFFNSANAIWIIFSSQCLFTVNDELVSSIGRGLCVLVGISKDDTKAEVDYM